MKKILFTILMSVLTLSSYAYDFEVNGIYYYKISGKTNEVIVVDYSSRSILENVTIPSTVIYNNTAYSVTRIGSNAFSCCSGLTSVTIPNSVTSIGNMAFRDCSGLTSVTIPNSVTSIESEAFESCSGLKSVTIPNSVTSIGSYAFYDCSGLTSIKVDKSNTKYDSRDNCNAIIETATNTLITGCKNTIIPSSVTSIEDCAFYNCTSLTSIEIPNSVTSIGSEAFDSCSGLTSVKVNLSRPLSIESEVFRDLDIDKCILYVPKGTSMMFMCAPGWVDFKNIQEFSDEEDTHFISIKQDGGTIMQEVELGKVYEYKIVANEGWKINTISFNGNDVTASLFNGLYSTPIIIGNSELNVVFKKISDVVKAVVSSDIKVFGYGNTISITGAEDNANVLVYDYDGTLIANEKGNAKIELYEGGVYIIKVDDETFKVRL